MREKKIALIVQRYGKQANGGSEVFSRMIAEKLNLKYDVTVLTSRAIDYHTWAPELPEGLQSENGIKIMRFDHEPKFTPKIIHQRNRRDRGRYLYQKLYRFFGRPSWYLKIFPTSEIKPPGNIGWVINQGPATFNLTEYLKENEINYDAFIFVTYLYYPSVAGLMAIPNKSIFIPTMHDEPEAHDPIFQKLMTLPKSLIFLTEAEKKFSNKVFKISHIRQDVMSVGIDPVSDIKDESVIKKFGIKGKYIIYVGRIDSAKGCKELLAYFADYLKDTKAPLSLVLAGKNMIEPVVHENIIYAGFVTDEEKEQLTKHAEALIIPSKYESLSLVVLESFACKVPVIANGLCEVLKDHIELSKGGWLFTDKQNFYTALNEVLADKDNQEKGKAGYDYVMNNFVWDKVLKAYDNAIEYVIASNAKSR